MIAECEWLSYQHIVVTEEVNNLHIRTGTGTFNATVQSNVRRSNEKDLLENITHSNIHEISNVFMTGRIEQDSDIVAEVANITRQIHCFSHSIKKENPLFNRKGKIVSVKKIVFNFWH